MPYQRILTPNYSNMVALVSGPNFQTVSFFSFSCTCAGLRGQDSNKTSNKTFNVTRADNSVT